MLSYPADMAELADAPDLGSGVERRAGSSPVIRIFYKAWKPYDPVSHCVGIFRKGFCKGTSPVPLHTLGFFGKHEPWCFRFVMCRRKTGFLVAVWARGIWSFFRLLVAKAHK